MSTELEPISDQALASVSGGMGYGGYAAYFYQWRKRSREREQQQPTPGPGPNPAPPTGSAADGS